eukprot:1181572-Prymnesium_polylepis.1
MKGCALQRDALRNGQSRGVACSFCLLHHLAIIWQWKRAPVWAAFTRALAMCRGGRLAIARVCVTYTRVRGRRVWHADGQSVLERR